MPFARSLIRPLLLIAALGPGAALAALPDYAYRPVEVADDSDPKIHALVKEAAEQVHPEPIQARRKLLEALRKVHAGAAIDEYDYLWTQYGLLQGSFYTDTARFLPGVTPQDYIKVAENVLAFLDESAGTGTWHFTELGQFREEVYRQAANGEAWQLHQTSKNPATLRKALELANVAEGHMRGSEDNYILDTKVRILLKLKRSDDAYKIVKAVLDEDPSFGDFQDLAKEPSYLRWLKTHR